MNDESPRAGPRPAPSRPPERLAREADALRANLHRRKHQQRAREAASPPPPPADLPPDTPSG